MITFFAMRNIAFYGHDLFVVYANLSTRKFMRDFGYHVFINLENIIS